MNAGRPAKGFAQLLISLAILLCLTQTGPSQTTRARNYNFSKMDVPGAIETHVSGINDKGHIVGQYETNKLTWVGFLLSEGTFYTLMAGTAETGVNGINRLGDIVGYYRDSATGPTHGFLRNATSTQPIMPPGGSESLAFGINDKGSIVGESNAGDYTAFCLSGGSYTQILYSGATGMSAMGINNRGHIVGSAGSSGYVLAGGAYTLFDYPGAASTAAIGINDGGDIVGVYLTSLSSESQGFLRSDGTFWPIEFPGAVSTIPTDINRSGQIVGRYKDSGGVVHGFLAEPQKGGR